MDSQLGLWTDGATRSAVVDFVAVVTEEGGPDYVEPPAREERQLVGQVQADHLGVQQVVAVATHARHPEGDGQLRRRAEDAQSAPACRSRNHTPTANRTAP